MLRISRAFGVLSVALVAVGCTGITPSATDSPAASTPSPLATQAPASPSAPVAPTSTPFVPTAAPAATDTAAPPTAVPDTAPPVTEPPTPTAPPAAGPLTIDWQKVSRPGIGPAANITASAAAGGRFVIVGEDADVNPALWTSGNGRDWTSVTVPASEGFLTFEDVISDGTDFIAVGTDYNVGSPQGLAFGSIDGGRTWQPLASSGEGWSYDLVAAIGYTIVIAATDENSSEHRFDISHDGGATWSTVDAGAAPTSGLFALTTTADGFWAFTGNSDSARGEIEIWRSPDGESWTMVGTLPGSGKVASLAVAQGPLGWVAAGDAYQRSKELPLAWWSTDGVSWQASDSPPFSVSDIFADDAGFIAVGHYYPNGTGCVIDEAEAVGLTWTSPDGLLWRRMPEDGWQGRYVVQLRRYNRTLVGIGLDWRSSVDGEGAVWTSELPDASSDSGPVPSNPPLTNAGCG